MVKHYTYAHYIRKKQIEAARNSADPPKPPLWQTVLNEVYPPKKGCELKTVDELLGATKNERLERMDEEVYHLAKGYGSSIVKVAYHSPKALAEYLDRPDYMKRKTTPSLEFGSVFHRMLLEPERFAKEYVFAEKAYENYTLRAAKDHIALMEAKNPGKKVIKVEEAYVLKQMKASCDKIPQLGKLLGEGLKTEVSYFANRDGYIGKARFDVENTKIGMFADVKTIEELSLDKIQRNFTDYFYDVQFAHYMDVANAVNADTKDWPFVFIFVEKKAPYNACLIVPSDEMVAFAKKRFAVCQQNIKRYMQNIRDSDIPEMMQVRPPEWLTVKTLEPIYE